MENFWKGKRVFITGGSGFIGSRLITKLIDLGSRVHAIQHIHEIKDRRASVFLGFDISDAYQFMDLPTETYDIVFHLAAYPIVTKAETNPDTAFGTNVVGTYNVIRAFPDTTMIVASTDKVYGRAEIPYTESTPLLGTQQSYEATKAAADILAQSFFYRGQKLAITRACNIFGYDKELTRIIPHIITSLIEGKNIKLRSSPNYIRDYLYVDDIVDGYLKLGEWRYTTTWGKYNPVAFNFGGYNYSVRGLIEIISGMMNVEGKFEVIGDSTEEINAQSLDWTLAREVLGWMPSAFFVHLQKTIQEYSVVRNGD